MSNRTGSIELGPRPGARSRWTGLIAIVLLAAGISLAVQTNEVEVGRNSNYDGTVTITRDASGRMTFIDGENVTPVTLSQMFGSDINSLDAADGNPSDVVFVDSSGKVGIGTTGPQTTLHLLRSVSSSPISMSTATFVVQRNGLDSDFASIAIIGGNGGGGLSALEFGDADDRDAGRIYYEHAVDEMSFYAGALRRVVINSIGTMGIGDTSPSNGGLVVAAGVVIGADSTNNLIDDASNGSGSTTLYIGNKTISTVFTAAHYYRLGDLDLSAGELVRLEGGKIYRTRATQDPKAIGIFWGVTNFEDSMGNALVREIVEPPRPSSETDGLPAAPRTKSYRLVRAADSVTSPTFIDFAYAVAVLGDSYEPHTATPLNGAWVSVANGPIEEGDLLCSSGRAGYLEKQPDDIVHSYTVGIAREEIAADSQTAYIFLLQ